MIVPAIVCIAKLEQDYIEEFVKYHLALGFKYIYLYDNEDEPTYQKMLQKYKENVIVIHAPFNNHYKPIQYIVLPDCTNTIYCQQYIAIYCITIYCCASLAGIPKPRRTTARLNEALM